MPSKRDLQLVRQAVRWKWFTPEQGEDVLFLKRKFGDRLTIEEIIRRRGYLQDADIQQLADKANELTGTRPKLAPIPGRAAGAAFAGVLHERGADLAPGEGETPPGEIVPSTDIMAPAQPARIAEPPPMLDAMDPNDGVFGDSAATVIAPLPTLLGGDAARPFGEEDEAEVTAIAPPMDLDMFKHPAAEGARPPGAQRDVLSNVPRLGISKRRPGEATKQAQALMRPEPKPLGADPGPFRGPRPSGSRPSAIAPNAPSNARNLGMSSPLRLASVRPLVSDAADGGAAGVLPRGTVVGGTFFEAARAAGTHEPELGHFRVQRVIARGSRGVVYLAEAPGRGEVALRVLTREARGSQTFARLRQTAPRLMRIDSPRVVKLLDLGMIEGRAFMAMQYVDGWALEERLDFGDRPRLAESLEIARAVAEGLEALEAGGALHQDVHPGNILIARSGEVMLAGLGFPRIHGQARNGAPIFGTKGYLAPELLDGQAPDARSDLFALGATLFQLITGVRALPDQAEDERAAAPSVATIDGSLPEAVVTLVDRLLAPRREDRFPSARSAITAIEAALEAVSRAGVIHAVPAGLERARRPVGLPAAIASIVLVGLSIGAPAVLVSLGLAGGVGSTVALKDAFLGTTSLLFALLLFTVLGLVRRGDLPLPTSTIWLVRLQDGVGALGAALLIAGVELGPRALLNLLVAGIAALALSSSTYGMLLRGAVASHRPDGGVGRVLAVLGDQNMSRWRRVHLPLVTTLASLSGLRLAFLAYFASTQSVVS